MHRVADQCADSTFVFLDFVCLAPGTWMCVHYPFFHNFFWPRLYTTLSKNSQQSPINHSNANMMAFVFPPGQSMYTRRIYSAMYVMCCAHSFRMPQPCSSTSSIDNATLAALLGANSSDSSLTESAVSSQQPLATH